MFNATPQVNQQTTTTTLPTSLDHDVFRRSFDATLGVLVVILNSIQIVLILRMARNKTIYLKLLLSLAVADLLFGLSNIVISAIHLDQLQLNVFLITEIATTIFLFCITTSILHISWIALDRLWAVTFPIHH